MNLMHGIPHKYEHVMTLLVEYIRIESPELKDLCQLFNQIWNIQGNKGKCDINVLVVNMSKDRYELI